MRISGIWKNSDFFKLWSATTISQMGTQVSFIALPLIAVIFLRATPFEVSVLNAIDFLPSVLFGLPVGVWVDRHRRRPIMIISDIIRGFGLLMIPISAGLHLMSIWQLYIVVFIIGAFSVPFDVAYQSFLPSLMEKNDLVKGNAALELSQSGSRIAGPTVAGLLISLFTAPIAIIADSISYFGSAVFLLFIRKPNDHMASNKDFSRARFFIKTKEGITYVFRHQLLRHFAIYGALSNLGWSVIEGILMVYAVRTLHLGAGLVGLAFTVSNAGLILAATIVSQMNKRLGPGIAMALSCILQGFGVLLVLAASFRVPLVLLTAGLLIRSFGVVAYGVNAMSLRQAITPDHMRGRVNATMRFISWGTIPAGSLLGGVLGTLFGMTHAIFIGTVIYLLAVLQISLSPVRTLHVATD
jgi:MFS family permease